MSSKTQLLIPTKGPKRADYLYIGHQQEILLHLRKEKAILKNTVMYVVIFFLGNKIILLSNYFNYRFSLPESNRIMRIVKIPCVKYYITFRKK